MTSPAVFARLAHSPAGPPAPPGQPALPPVPAGPAAGARAHAARALLRRVAARLPIRVQAPDGSISGAGGPGAPALMILREDAFYRRLGAGTAGLAEGYMAGDWIAPDLVGLFTALAVHVAEIVPRPLQVLRRWYIPREPAGEDATIDGARRNIVRHYDLSDDLFALFLDPTMTYSSALFAPGDTLADGQRRKIDTLLDRTGTGPGTTVPAYFTTIDRLLTPGGRTGLQAITMPHDRMCATRGGHTWIHKYIFPGGQIPSLQAITDVLRARTGLRVTADYPMGPHYARTLHEWRGQFNDAAEAVSELGFGPVFQRMWDLYLAYSEAGFRAGYLDVHQLVLERRAP